MKTIYSLLSIFALVLAFTPSIATAQDADEAAIKERMLARIDTIDALKIANTVGENNAGLLEQRGPLKPEETKAMNAENADRRALYTIAGKRLGITATVVGQGRAEDLREKSASGVWLQDRSGSWYKKK